MISEEYRQQLNQLHTEKPDFGTSASMYAPLIKGVMNRYKPKDLLDYGSGKCALQYALGIVEGYHPYDPSIPGIDETPKPRDLVVCCDVLEHVESQYVLPVLDDLRRCTKKAGFFAVHTGAALNVLPDGRNAHITQMPAEWWLDLILERFNLTAYEKGGNGFWCIVEPK